MRRIVVYARVAALAFGSLCATSAFAADAENRFAIKGAGIAKCSAFVQAFDSRSNDAYIFAGWITGYITALNQSTPKTFDFAPWQSTDVLMILLRDLCGRNPDQQVYRVAGGLVQIMARDRVETLSEPVQMENGEHKVTQLKEVVRRVQERLKEEGVYKGTADGSYGAGTRKALETYQTQQKLPVTGVADPQTLMRLMYPEKPAKPR